MGCRRCPRAEETLPQVRLGLRAELHNAQLACLTVSSALLQPPQAGRGCPPQLWRFVCTAAPAAPWSRALSPISSRSGGAQRYGTCQARSPAARACRVPHGMGNGERETAARRQRAARAKKSDKRVVQLSAGAKPHLRECPLLCARASHAPHGRGRARRWLSASDQPLANAMRTAVSWSTTATCSARCATIASNDATSAPPSEVR